MREYFCKAFDGHDSTKGMVNWLNSRQDVTAVGVQFILSQWFVIYYEEHNDGN
jgi:hypothetical protein